MSVYEKFLDKNKSKLCESKSKKVSLKKLKNVNENQVESDETVLEKVYTNQNVKETLRIDKCYMDDGTIEYVVNCNILGVEEWFTDFSKAKEYYYEIMGEFKREVDNYYEDDDDTIDESAKDRKPKKPFLRKSLKESAKDRFVKKAASKSKLSESKKEWEEHLKETFDKFNGRLIDAYSYLGGAISIGEWINKNLSDYPQEIQDFMSEVDLNKLNEISNNMRPIVKGVTKTFYDTYKYKK